MYGIKRVGVNYTAEQVALAKELLRQERPFAEVVKKTGIVGTTLRNIRNEVDEERDSERARKDGCYYIINECAGLLMGAGYTFAEKNGAYYINGKNVTIGDVITKANECLARKGISGKLGKNPAWHKLVVNSRPQ